MKYFTISELTKSATAQARGLNNVPNATALANLYALVDNILDPLREAWGRPIYVSNGYRSPAVNKAVGGVATSQHLTGQAADISAGNPTDNCRLFQLAVSLGLPFDQIIDENNFQWVHISYDPKRNRREKLKYANGKYTRIP